MDWSFIYFIIAFIFACIEVYAFYKDEGENLDNKLCHFMAAFVFMPALLPIRIGQTIFKMID